MKAYLFLNFFSVNEYYLPIAFKQWHIDSQTKEYKNIKQIKWT